MANRSHVAPSPNLPPRTYELSTVPKLNGVSEGIRARMGQYVEYMRLGGKTARRVIITRDQLNTLRRSINTTLLEGAPPLWWVDLPGPARGRAGRGGWR